MPFALVAEREPRQRIDRLEAVGNICYSEVDFHPRPGFGQLLQAPVIVAAPSIVATIGLEQLCGATFDPDCIMGIIGFPLLRRAALDTDGVMKGLAEFGIVRTNPAQIRNYLRRHADVLPILYDIAREVRQALPYMPLALEMVSDPEDAEGETLVLYLQPAQAAPSLFEHLDHWNQTIAERLLSSEAWFLVNLDLRKLD